MTLADEGWIRTANEPPTRWEVTARILALAHAATGSNDLRQRARPILEKLRDETGETVFLAVPDIKNFVIADVIESRQALRMVPNIGISISAHNSATGRALLPFMNADRQIALLESAPDEALLENFELTRQRGYSVSEGEINIAATNIAAPIFEFNRLPIGAVVVCGPRERLEPSLEAIGAMTARAAQELSQGSPKI
jgi:IclR family acetate operon transcriptional repressor